MLPYRKPDDDADRGGERHRDEEADEAEQIRAYANVPEARASIGRYIDGFYNARRPHSSLDRRTPDEAYFTALQPIAVAA